MKKKCQQAYAKGVECVLNCQIRVDEKGRVVDFGTDAWRNGQRTVWCQQHDKDTFAPVKARAYELPSFSGCGETCAILNLLMDVENPSEEVREAVCSADILLGAERMIAGFTPRIEKRPYYDKDRIIPYIKEMLNEHDDINNIVILFSGDTGFYSGAAGL